MRFLMKSFIVLILCLCILPTQAGQQYEPQYCPVAVSVTEPVVEDLSEDDLSTDDQPVSNDNIDLGVSDEDIELIALVTVGEAEGECEQGQRLAIDTILNRVSSPNFPDSIRGAIYQPEAFSSMWDGRIERCHVTDQMRNLVREELAARTSYEPVYFRTGHYSGYGSPLYKVGNHYFSKE